MDVGRRLAANTSYLLLDWTFLTFFSLVFWIIIGKLLVPAEYGLISTSINFAIFFSTFTIIGITPAISKLIPEYVEKKKNKKYINSFISSALRPIFISLTIISASLLLLSPQLSVLLKMPLSLFLINILLLITISFYNFMWSTFYGFQQMRKIFVIDTMFGIGKIILSVSLIYLGFRQFGAVFAVFLSYLLVLLFKFNFRYFKPPSINIGYKNIFFYAIPALIVSITISIINNSQYIILTILKNPEVTGIFTPAYALSSLIFTIPSIINSGLFPIISQLSVEKGTKREQTYLINLVLRYALFIMIPSAALLLIFSKNFILLYTSQLFLQATEFFPILVPAAILFGTGHIFLGNLYAIGKPNINRNIMILISSVFVISAIILTNYFSAIGLSSSFLLISSLLFILTFSYLKKFLKVKFYKKDIIKILLSSSVIGITGFYFRFIIFNTIVFILFLLSLGVLYILILNLLRFFRYEDVRLLEFFVNRLPVLKYPLKILLKLIKVSDNV